MISDPFTLSRHSREGGNPPGNTLGGGKLDPRLCVGDGLGESDAA